MATTDTPLSRIIPVHDIAWTNLRPGVQVKRIWEDPPTQRLSMMLRFEPGVEIPLHRHDGDELVYVIEGSLTDESGTITTGNFGYRPNGCVHTITSQHGATVLSVLTGSTTPVDSGTTATGC